MIPFQAKCFEACGAQACMRVHWSYSMDVRRSLAHTCAEPLFISFLWHFYSDSKCSGTAQGLGPIKPSSSLSISSIFPHCKICIMLSQKKELNFTLQFFRPLNSPPRATERKNIIIPTVVGGRGKQNHKQPRRQNKACWPTDRHGSAQTCIICRQPASF